MVFDYEKAMEDRAKQKEKRKTRQTEKLSEPTSENKKKGYAVSLDIKNWREGDDKLESVNSDDPVKAIFEAADRAKKAGKRVNIEGCMARDIETNELFTIHGKHE